MEIIKKVHKTTKPQGEKTMRQILSILIIGLFVSISGASAFAASPPISWQPSSVEETVELGGAPIYVYVDATLDIALNDLEIFIVPELRPFVTVEIFSVAEGTVVFELAISAPSSESAGVYDGTIHLRQGKNIIAKPLPVVVHVGEEIGVGGGTFTSDDGQATLVIPQGAISGDPLLFGVDEIPIDDFFFQPAWGTLIGPVVYDFYPDGAVFDKPLKLTITYNPAFVSSESDIRIGYEKTNGDIVGLDDCSVNTTANTVTCSVWHFTRFLIIEKNDNDIPPNDPSFVSLYWLNIGTPEENPSIGVLDWDNPSDPDFSHVIIFKSSSRSVLGEVFLTEVKDGCGINEVGCTEGPDLEVPLDLGQNCFMVRAVDKAGNVSNTATLQENQRCVQGF